MLISRVTLAAIFSSGLLLGLTAASPSSANEGKPDPATESVADVEAAAKSGSVMHGSKVRRVRIHPSGTQFSLSLATNHDSCTSTNDPKRYNVTVGQGGVTQAGFEMIYAAALEALNNGRALYFYFESGTPNCYISEVFIDL